VTESEVKDRAFAMPLTSPAFPPGPYRFVNREFFIITYRTDSDALLSVIPAPLEFTQPPVKFEFIGSFRTSMTNSPIGPSRSCGRQAPI
jgi:acetoacetate decarboxylase